MVDPGFPPGGGGANIQFCQILRKNCMKLKEFGPRGASKMLLCRSATHSCRWRKGLNHPHCHPWYPIIPFCVTYLTQRGTGSSEGHASLFFCNFLAKKLHENEKIWTGGGRPWRALWIRHWVLFCLIKAAVLMMNCKGS